MLPRVDDCAHAAAHSSARLLSCSSAIKICGRVCRRPHIDDDEPLGDEPRFSNTRARKARRRPNRTLEMSEGRRTRATAAVAARRGYSIARFVAWRLLARACVSKQASERASGEVKSMNAGAAVVAAILASSGDGDGNAAVVSSSTLTW